MKKSLSILAGFFLIFILAACNQTAEPVDEPEKNNEETEATEKTEEKAEEKVSELTLEEVMNKSTEASVDLKSFSVKMDLTQDMSDQGDLNVQTNSVIDMNIVTEPMAFYQKMNMSMGEESESFETESYFSEAGMFFYEPSTSQWMKFPQEMTDTFLQMSGTQSNPGEELKKLQQFVEDFTFEQDTNNYILKLKASGEKFNEFIKETAAQQLPPEISAEEALSDMKINAVDYEILIDKKTFYPVALNMDMDLEMTIDGQTIAMKQKMNGQYSNYNSIETITVPQEIIDSAVEMDM